MSSLNDRPEPSAASAPTLAPQADNDEPCHPVYLHPSSSVNAHGLPPYRAPGPRPDAQLTFETTTPAPRRVMQQAIESTSSQNIAGPHSDYLEAGITTPDQHAAQCQRDAWTDDYVCESIPPSQSLHAENSWSDVSCDLDDFDPFSGELFTMFPFNTPKYFK